jgi:calcineurin-like phosphoesterase family protein
MTTKDKLFRLRQDMIKSFQSIKADPMNLNRLMEHLMTVSHAVDLLIGEAVGPDYIFNLHVEMLGSIPEGYTRPQVAFPSHWGNLGRTIKAGDSVPLKNFDPESSVLLVDQHGWAKNKNVVSVRPFADLPHMHAEMAKRFKMTTKPGQIVIWCGDVAFIGTTELREIMKDYQHTYNILVVGNHDIERDGKLRKVDQFFDEVHTSLHFGNYIVTHHPWVNMLPEGMINIHGHMHDRPFTYHNHVCACVELINYAPVSLAYLLNRVKETNRALAI